MLDRSALSLALLAALLTAAPASAERIAAAESASVAPVERNKTLRMSYDADPVSLDPHEHISLHTLQVSHLLFDPLVRWRQDQTFEPRLAQSWEISPDYTTYVFNLRPSVRFHSGRDLSAKDVVFTLNRLRESPDFKALFEPVESVAARDDLTVEVKTKAPYPLLLNLATYVFPMDSEFYSGTDERGRAKDEIVKHGASFASTNVSGTGPFTVVRREQGVLLELERNPDYWDEKSPGNVGRIVYRPIKESATRVAALLSDGVDFIAPVPPTDIARVKAHPCCEVITMQGTRILTFQLNQARVEAFRDPRVRRAINLAINREGIVDRILRGFASPAAQLSPPNYVGHNPDLSPEHGVEKAQSLMKEAGYADGFSVTMMAPNNRYVSDYRIAEAVAAMLARIGIKVDLQTMPMAQYWQKFDERAGDIMMIGWHSDTEDSANFAEFLVMTPDPETGYGQYNAGNYANPDLDALVLSTQSMTEPDERAEALRKVEAMIHDDAALVPLHWEHLSWAARKGVDIGRVVNVIEMPYLGDLVIE
jgi:peptide/nickel transport system substrate-binding protein